jgi:hypothetical protein
MRGAIAALMLVSSGQLGCQVVAAMLQGTGCGLSPSSCSSQQNRSESSGVAQSQEEARAACFSDYGCQYGSKCVKAPYRTEGYCARAVNEYGVQTYPVPASESVMPGGQGQCGFDTDCPIAFRCAIEPGSLRGACLKRY